MESNYSGRSSLENAERLLGLCKMEAYYSGRNSLENVERIIGGA